MKKKVFAYGGFGLFLGLVLFLSGLYFGSGMDFSTQKVFGYITMVLLLLVVFFGIKHFRDRENHGVISFGKAVTLGLLISSFKALRIMYILR